MQSNHVKIFDTTLRDGEQSPGASMNPLDKVRVARQLVDLGVDIIEAGFPVASDGDFEGVAAVAKEVGDRAVVAALARCVEVDICKAAQALSAAVHPRIHVFCATSAIHREFKLKLGKTDIISRTRQYVALAKQMLRDRGDVEFSPEDASRTELDFLVEVTAAAIESGATTINLPDTVGYAMPWEYGEIFSKLRSALPVIDERGIVLSAHCHNDLGHAVSNALFAVKHGARQVEVTLAGIGERCGNTQMEALVMSLHTRTEYRTNINTRLFGPAVRLLSEVTGLEFARNQPVSGRNAFSHESGIHQDGIVKNPATYEIMRPEDVGWNYSSMVFGKHSGRAGLAGALKAHGITLEPGELDKLFVQFKTLADLKREVYESDLLALLAELRGTPVVEGWQFVRYRLLDADNGHRRAEITLQGPDNQLHVREATGDGPLHAMYQAIRDILGLKQVVLSDFKVRGVTRGDDALAESSIVLHDANQKHRGLSAHPDLLMSCVLAYLHAANRIVAASGAA